MAKFTRRRVCAELLRGGRVEAGRSDAGVHSRGSARLRRADMALCCARSEEDEGDEVRRVPGHRHGNGGTLCTRRDRMPCFRASGLPSRVRL